MERLKATHVIEQYRHMEGFIYSSNPQLAHKLSALLEESIRYRCITIAIFKIKYK